MFGFVLEELVSGVTIGPPQITSIYYWNNSETCINKEEIWILKTENDDY